MNERRIACIVEGHGEVEALPVLLRRIHAETGALARPNIRPRDVLRVPRTRLVRENELERAVELAARRVGDGGALLILIDADDDMPCALGPRLLERASKTRPDRTIGVVVAQREFEAWFLAAPSSLGLAGARYITVDPESIRDAKGAVRAALGTYSPVIDQASLCARMDLTEARARSASFDKMLREVCRLLALE